MQTKSYLDYKSIIAELVEAVVSGDGINRENIYGLLVPPTRLSLALPCFKLNTQNPQLIAAGRRED